MFQAIKAVAAGKGKARRAMAAMRFPRSFGPGSIG